MRLHSLAAAAGIMVMTWAPDVAPPAAVAQERVPGLTPDAAWVFVPSPQLSVGGTMVRFQSSIEAKDIIDRIMSVVGLPPRFEVYAGPVGNAAARIEQGGVRVIYYSESWVQRTIAQDEWMAITLMAHEIGHHLSNHTLAALDDRPLQELEADRFAGFIVARLGGSLDDAQRLFEQTPVAASPTHPSRAERLEAVAVGWREGARESDPSPAAPRPAPQETPAAAPEANVSAPSASDPAPPETPAAQASADAPQARELQAAAREAEARAAEAQAARDRLIRAAQVELRRLRLYSGPVDGDWGPGSRGGMERFQRASRRPVDGEITEPLLAALRAEPTPEPEPAPAAPSPETSAPETPAAETPAAERSAAAPNRPAPGTAPQASTADPGAPEIFRDCPSCPEMVVVGSGTFLLGSPPTEWGRVSNEGPVQLIAVPRFAIGKYEVTFREWDACRADGFCRGARPNDENWGRGGRPVINVSWDEINGRDGFIAWLNAKADGAPYRLPSEAEWEYAARAGTQTAYSFGDDPRALGAHAWFGANSRARTQPVGGKTANAFGLYDMHGNVWEWVQDCWRNSHAGAPTDGSARMRGDCSRAIPRGGSWGNSPEFLRSAYRVKVGRKNRYNYLGFRVARTLRD